jgi:RNA 2',3'-cyclic 3'-phosphodiesterase
MPRLFFALRPDESSREALSSAASEALRLSRGRAVPPENWHVTLAFLGSVPSDRVSSLVTVAGSVSLATSDPTLSLIFDRIEYWRSAELLCAVAQRESVVAGFVGVLRERLASAFFAPDLKPFRAHVTLMRKVAPIQAPLRMTPTEWTFRQFALCESQTRATGSIYSVVESWPLVRNEPLAH